MTFLNASDLHTRDKYGDPALLYSIYNGDLDALKYLVEHGAEQLCYWVSSMDIWIV